MNKPLGHKSYGSIGHLPASRMGPSDHHVHEGQASICTQRCRPGDVVIVTEKLDGSNVAVLMQDGVLHAINRAGYLCDSSPHEQHRMFAAWIKEGRVYRQFNAALRNGDRICGEWLALAHGTRYRLDDPFVAFDIIRGHERIPYSDFVSRCTDCEIPTVPLLHLGKAVSVESANAMLGDKGYYRAITPDKAEGVVYRVEHEGSFEFMAKWVRPDKVDGKYLVGAGHGATVATWNWRLAGWESAPLTGGFDGERW